MNKTCPKCSRTMNERHFNKRNERPCGRQTYCKACTKKCVTEYYYKKKDVLKSPITLSYNFYIQHRSQLLAIKKQLKRKFPVMICSEKVASLFIEGKTIHHYSLHIQPQLKMQDKIEKEVSRLRKDSFGSLTFNESRRA